ncbi:hypothetical protein EHQ12_06035 [Leptospira gomenensis]|uniref:Band 7 domain-containing protein n=1 Tax=Leptospira gomenensis TaxID=2484974 RepID=A0A5F1Z0A5_9LEPT|nr:hypothetical protein [Leptospira gomenensis]TGK30965.1 hypothetical protein EHQ17_14685 [Leptospira gomenensis]TGK41747.1 hypothetical protein EHQ12_06035 [Leptospira gomenensis]TGK45315.1 hypothetical protein EHQ07_10310 [Leptospira gomenensis]TGK66228.1 hypothetical protein EHQ13_04045 [Leptospira gomenensis]
MRFWSKLFWIFVPGLLAALLYFCVFPLKEGDSLLVVDGSEEILEYTSGPGYVFEWKALFPWNYGVVRFPISSRVSQIITNVDLASGLFPESSSEGKARIRLEIRYSLEPDHVPRFLEASGVSDEKVSQYISKIVYSILRKKTDEYLSNPATLKQNLLSYLSSDFSKDLTAEETSFKSATVRISDIQIPDPALITGIFKNQNLLLQKKLELVAALSKAETIKIEEEAKTTAMLRRLERTKDFAVKNPDMREFLLYESLSDNVEVILLPSEMILGEIPSSKKKKNGAVKKPKEVE